MSTTIVTVGGASRLVHPAEVPLLGCIEIDPPWPERGGGKIKRGADRHYPVMEPWQIVETIIRSPLWRPDRAGGCHLYLHATNNALAAGSAHFIAEALGFRPITVRTWHKDHVGLGQYFRGETEHVLFCSCVPARVPPPGPSPPTTYYEGRRSQHSKKPDRVADMERVSPGARAELFAREVRDGWWQWGNDPALAAATAPQPERPAPPEPPSWPTAAELDAPIVFPEEAP